MQICKAQTQIVIHADPCAVGVRRLVAIQNVLTGDQIFPLYSLSLAFPSLYLGRHTWSDDGCPLYFFSGKATLSDIEDLLTNWLELLEWKRGPRETYLSADPSSCWLRSHQIIPFGLSDASALALFKPVFRFLYCFSFFFSSFFHVCPCRIYSKLPEVRKKKEAEKKRAISQTNRLRVEVFKKVDLQFASGLNSV